VPLLRPLGLLGLVMALVMAPAPSLAQQVDTAHVITLGTTEITNGTWILPPPSWKVLYEYTQWCLGKQGPPFESIKWAVADAIRGQHGEIWAGLTLRELRDGPFIVIYIADMVGDINLLIHEMIHVVAGPDGGEYHPPAPPGPAFRRCLPSLRYLTQ
jgi:hypothetical protein